MCCFKSGQEAKPAARPPPPPPATLDIQDLPTPPQWADLLTFRELSGQCMRVLGVTLLRCHFSVSASVSFLFRCHVLCDLRRVMQVLRLVSEIELKYISLKSLAQLFGFTKSSVHPDNDA